MATVMSGISFSEVWRKTRQIARLGISLAALVFPNQSRAELQVWHGTVFGIDEHDQPWWISETLLYGIEVTYVPTKEGLLDIVFPAVLNVKIPLQLYSVSVDRVSSLVNAAYQNRVRSVYFDEGIDVDGRALIGCVNLERVEFPSTLSEIPSLRDCQSLKHVTIKCPTARLVPGMFSSCTNLISVYLAGGPYSNEDLARLGITGRTFVINEYRSPSRGVEFIFNANGGVFPEKGYNGQTKTVLSFYWPEGGTYSHFPGIFEAKREGYTQNGWWTLPIGGAPLRGSWTVLDGATVRFYAHWDPQKYNVYFYRNEYMVYRPVDGDLYDSQSIAWPDVLYDSLMVFPQNPFDSPCDGFVFKGWKISKDGDAYAAGEAATFGPKMIDENRASVYFFAAWGTESVDVSFDPNGGTCTEKRRIYMSDRPYGSLPIPQRDYARFLGWYDTKGNLVADGTQVPDTVMSLTLQAKWEVERSVVVFDACGGFCRVAQREIERGSTLEMLPEPYRFGCDFEGWYFDDGRQVLSSSAITEQSVTIWARWKFRDFHVMFDANGGQGTMPVFESGYDRVGEESETIIPDNAFSREGFVFDGWAGGPTYDVCFEDGGSVFDLMQCVNGAASVTLYAHWIGIKYKVRFWANGGDGSPYEQIVSYGSYQAIETNRFERSGFVFSGWATTPNGAIEYPDRGLVYNLTTSANEIIDFYAAWAPAYKIGFRENGGQGEMQAITVRCGESVGLPACRFMRFAHDFFGWAESEGGSVAYADHETVVDLAAQGDVKVLWAIWKPKPYSLPYDPRAVTNGVFVLPPAPARKGYDFMGWSDGVSVWQPGAAYQMNGREVDFQAVWSPHPYRVVLNGNGGTVDASALEELKVLYLPFNGSLVYGPGMYESLSEEKWWKAPHVSYGEDRFGNPRSAAQFNGDTYVFQTGDGNGLSFGSPFMICFWACPQKSEQEWLLAPIDNSYESLGIRLGLSGVSVTDGTGRVLCGHSGDLSGWHYYVIEDSDAGTSLSIDGVFKGEFAQPVWRRMGFPAWGKADTSSRNRPDRGLGGWGDSCYTGLIDDLFVLKDDENAIRYIRMDDLLVRSNFEKGIQSGPLKAEYDQPIQLPGAIFAREGYDFLGWSLDASGDVSYWSEAVVSNLTAESNVRVDLWAVWLSRSCTLKLNANGGSGTMREIVFPRGQSVVIPACEFRREGYLFSGWAVVTDGPVVYQSGTCVSEVPPEGCKELFAVWTPIEYRVVFNANGGVGTMSEVSCRYDEPIVLPGCGFTSDMHDFACWSPSRDVSVRYEAGASVKNLTAEPGATVALYACWWCDVSFSAVGGVCEERSKHCIIGAPIGDLPVPEAEDKAFIGWYTQPSGGVRIWPETPVTGSFTCYAQWEKSLVIGKYTWKYKPAAGGVMLTACEPALGGSVALPSSVEGLPVVSVGEIAAGNSSLLSVTIPEGVVEIADNAFNGCGALAVLSSPASLRIIGKDAFAGCSPTVVTSSVDVVKSIGSVSNVRALSIVGSVAKLTEEVFAGNRWMALESVVVQSAESDVIDQAFRGCPRLEMVRFSDGLTSVSAFCFADCPRLRSVDLPATLVEWGEAAFGHCLSLSEVRISSENKAFKVMGGLVYSADGRELVLCPGGLSRAEIECGTEIVRGRACFECGRLSDVSIPSGVRDIGWLAFAYCTNLTFVSLPSTLTNVSSGAFTGVKGIRSVAVPQGLDIRDVFAQSYDSIAVVTLTSSVVNPGWTHVPPGVVSATVAEGVESLEADAFSGCKALVSVALPGSLEVVGSASFWGCCSLETIDMPEGVKIIGGSAFRNCTALKKLRIPSSIEIIDEDAFAGCGVITDPLTVLDGWLIGMNGTCSSRVVVPDGVRGIAGGVFRNCTSLQELSLPSSLQFIGVRAFSGCTGLKRLTLPKGLTTILTGAFENVALVALEIPESVMRLGDCAFDGFSGRIMFAGGKPNFCTDYGSPAAEERLWSYWGAKSTSILFRHGVSGWLHGEIWAGALTLDDSLVGRCVITLDPQGGVVSNAEMIVDIGEEIGAMPQPEKDGSAFGGWFTDPCDGMLVRPSCIVSNVAQTLYAHWGAPVEVALAGLKIVLAAGCPFGDLPAAPLSTCPGAGLSFVGWSLSGDESGIVGPNSIVPAGLTSLHPIWAKVDCTVRFDVGPRRYEWTIFYNTNGCECAEANRVIGMGYEIGALPLAYDTLATFVGWRNKDGEIVDKGYRVEVDQTLDAVWCGCPIEFSVDDSSATITGFPYRFALDAHSWIPVQDVVIPGWLASREVVGMTDSAMQMLARASSLDVDAQCMAFTSEGNILYNRQKTQVLLALATVSNAVLEASVRQIRKGAFSACSQLVSITVPENFPYAELPSGEDLILPEYHALAGWCLEDGTLVTGGGCVPSGGQTLYKKTVKLMDGRAGWYVSVPIPVPSQGGRYLFKAKGLPQGMSIDAEHSCISGVPRRPGSYDVYAEVYNGTYAKLQETLHLQIVIGNYKDVDIPVQDEYGPYMPGVAIAVQVPEAAGTTVQGLPTGLKWTDNALEHVKLSAGGQMIETNVLAHSIYGTPTRPGKYVVTFSREREQRLASAYFTIDDLRTLDVVSIGAGNAKGAGAYMANATVSLKAKADKNNVFSGWYHDKEGKIPLKDLWQSPTYAYQMPTNGTTVYAHFLVVSDDWAFVDCSLDEEYATGVAISPVSVDVAGGSLPTVKVSGLPTGLKFTTKDLLKKGAKTEVEVPANSIYGTPAKSGVYSIVATVTTAGKKTASVSRTIIVRKAGENVVTVDVPDVNGVIPGKVTGMGVCAAGKSLTLKATASKNYVFAGWYQDAAFTVPAEGTVDYRKASFAVTARGKDQKLYARFAPTTSDRNIAVAVAGSYDLNGPWTKKLEVDSLSLPSVTVKGLPSGLKFDAKTLTIAGTPTKPGSYTVTLSLKNVTVKNVVTQTFVINVANIESEYLVGVNYAKSAYIYRGGVFVGWNIGTCARDGYAISGIKGLPTGLKYNAKTGRIEGVPTKAGSFTATITLKNGRQTSLATVSMIVNAIDTWAYGTFNGGSPSNQVQLTVSSAGKLSGKLFEGGQTYSLVANAYSAYNANTSNYQAEATASWSYKEGAKAIKTNEVWTILVAADAVGGGVDAGRFCAWQNVWAQKEWKDFGMSFFGRSGTVWTLTGEKYSLGAGESVALTIKPNGKVMVKGVFDTGTANRQGKPVYYSVSGSAVVCVTSKNPFVGEIFVYFAPDEGKSFGGYVHVVSIDEQ